MQDKTTLGISDTFRQFIEALVEEVVINGEPFDAQKKWLRKHSEREGISYETMESNLSDFFDAIKELEEHESKVIERSVKALAEDCYLSEDSVNKLIDHAAMVRAQNEAERKAQEEKERKAREKVERKAREEAERKTREEQDRIAKEKAQWQAKLDAERKAKEKAEHLALAEKQAREEAERERMARDAAEKKAEAERKAKEERERKAKEEVERRLREERGCKAKEEAERKAYEEYKRRELEGLPFREFPCIQQQLMTVVDKDKFDDYVFWYGRSLEKIKELFDDISNYLDDDDVKQSNKYSVYRRRSSNLMERAKKAQCDDIKSIERESDELVSMGRQMGYRVRENQKEIAYKKLVKRRTRIALVSTILVGVWWCFLILMRITKGEFLAGYSTFVQLLYGFIVIVPAFLGLLIVPFLWSKDFRKKE